MKKIVVILTLFIIANISKAQIAISYYPFQSQLSVSTNTEKFFWADYRIETNTFISNINMELSPMFNIKRTTFANYYIGPGINFNPAYAKTDLSVMNGYFIDFGVRAKPFQKYTGIQVLFEISPYVNTKFSGGNLRTRLGIAYNFNRSKKNEPKN